MDIENRISIRGASEFARNRSYNERQSRPRTDPAPLHMCGSTGSQYWTSFWTEKSCGEGAFNIGYPASARSYIIKGLGIKFRKVDPVNILEIGAGKDLCLATRIAKKYTLATVHALDIVDIDVSGISGAERIIARQAYAESRGYEDGQFNAVVSTFSLDYINRQDIYSEVYRILAPGGYGIFVLHHPESMFIPEIREKLDEMIRFRDAVIRGEEPMPSEKAFNDIEADISVKEKLIANLFGDGNEIETSLKECGFRANTTVLHYFNRYILGYGVTVRKGR